MHIMTFADYMGCAAVWMLTVLSALKLCFMLRKPSHTISGRLIDTTSGRDRRLELKIQQDEAEFHQKMGNITLKINEIWNTHGAYIAGDTLIMIPGLDTVDYAACRFLYKREFYYMINHVDLKIQMIKFLSVAIATVVTTLMVEMAWIPAIAITLMTGICLESLCRHIVENRADSFAREYASYEELKGGWRFLAAAHQENLKVPLAERWIQSLMRPTYFFRMKRLESFLSQGDEVLNEADIGQLAELLAKNSEEEALFIETKKQQVLRWIDADED